MIVVGPIFTLLVLIGIAALFVWMVGRSALENLDQRFASGEIDRAKYEAQRKRIGR
jgi:hypothetical protein